MATIFNATIRQEAELGEVLLFKPRQHTIVEYIRRRDCVFAIVQLHSGHFTVSVNEGLLSSNE